MEKHTPTRRFILKAGAIAGSGLMLGLRLSTPALAANPTPSNGFLPNAFVRIDRQGIITLIGSVANAEAGRAMAGQRRF